MKNIILYSYLKCSTCRKALNWLEKKGFEFQLKDIMDQPPSKKYLDIALKQFSHEKKRIFNTRGKSYNLIDFDINQASNEEIIKLLSSDGKLIKRPFLIYEEKIVLLGFNENDYINLLLKI